MAATPPQPLESRPSDGRIFRVGGVRFFNARPLLFGLAQNPRVRLTLDVPAALGEALSAGRLDVAMAPAIDYQRAAGRWVIVPDGCIASEDETLTVRIFSRCPIERITSLAVDADSHTSVVLARLVLTQRYGLSPQFQAATMVEVLSRPADQQPESILLIGDKVVAAGPNSPASPWPVQLDLGAAWRDWTGLPFVFAVWVARAGEDLGDLPALLSQAKDAGLANREQIVRDEAAAYGWPADLAREYFTRHLQYELTPRHRAALDKFYELAQAQGLIDRVTPIRLHPWRFCG